MKTHKLHKQLLKLFGIITIALLLSCDDTIKEDITEENNLVSTSSTSESTDTTAPQPPFPSTLDPFNIKPTEIRLKWDRATDSETPQNELHYKIFISENPDIDTFQNMTTNGEPYVDAWILDIRNIKIKGLNPDTLYYFNVVVIDHAGNTSAYTMTSAQTLP